MQQLPGVGFRLVSNIKLLFTAMSFSIFQPSSTTGVNLPYLYRLNPVKGPDSDLLIAAADGARITAMNGWLQYEGSDLQNGGLMTGCLYRGGDLATNVGLQNYNAIAMAPKSYHGRISKGAYSVWLPSENADTDFPDVNRIELAWQQPTICLAGTVATVAQQLAFTFFLSMHIEIKTISQLLQPKESSCGPEVLQLVHRVMRDFPVIMENPAHSKLIENFLSKVRNGLGTVSDVVDWVAENKTTLMNVASMLSMMI